MMGKTGSLSDIIQEHRAVAKRERGKASLNQEETTRGSQTFSTGLTDCCIYRGAEAKKEKGDRVPIRDGDRNPT